MAFDNTILYEGAAEAGDTMGANIWNSGYLQTGHIDQRPSAGNKGVMWVDTESLQLYTDNGNDWIPIGIVPIVQNRHMKEINRESFAITPITSGNQSLPPYTFIEDLTNVPFIGRMRLYLDFQVRILNNPSVFTKLNITQPLTIAVRVNDDTPLTVTIQPSSANRTQMQLDFITRQVAINQGNFANVNGNRLTVEIPSILVNHSEYIGANFRHFVNGHIFSTQGLE